MRAAVSDPSSVLVRRRLGDCLREITRGVGEAWPRFRVVGATRSGIAPAKEPVGKNPERYKLVEPGTIFYNPMRILLGSIAMVDDGQEPGITSPDYVVFRPNDGVVHHRWLYYWLRSPDGAAFIKTLTRGAVRERLLFRRLAVAEIDVPPYEMQRRFAEAVALIERARGASEARLEAAHALTDSILEQAFAHHDRTQKLADLSDGPDSFADGPFGSHLKTEHYTTAGARVIRLQNIGKGRFLDRDKAFIEMNRFEALQRHSVRPDDVVVAALGDGARPAGRACLVPEGLGPGLVKADCFRVRLSKERIQPRFLMWWLNSPRHLREVRDRMRGATRPRFTLGMVQESRVPLPPPREQEQIVKGVEDRLGSAGRCLWQLKAEIEALGALPAALLRRAFRGEL